MPTITNTNKTREVLSKNTKLSQCIKNMQNDLKFKFWIKTLISVKGTIPEIIRAVDKMIEIQASKVSFASNIYNKNGSTFNQVESVIDLSERKNFLLNIYIMSKKMTASLTIDEYEFLEKKYNYNWSAEEIANFYNCSIRTVYRKIDKLIDIICEYCIKQNWSLKFIESQTKNEGWLKEHYLKLVSEYIKNTNYKAEINY